MIPPVIGWRGLWDDSTDKSLSVAVVHKRPANWSAGLAQTGVKKPRLDVVPMLQAAGAQGVVVAPSGWGQEQVAVTAVRKVIQRLRLATPESFEDIRDELVNVQCENVEKLGSQA